MHLSRTFAIAAGAALLSVPVLSSCGFDDATDRVYTPGASTNNRDHTVDLLGAAIVAAQPASGTFVAGLSNAADEPVTLVSISGEGVRVPGFRPIEIAGDNGWVDLREHDVHVTGDVEAGDMVKMTFEFDNGETFTHTVPTVTSCDAFEGADTSEPTGDVEEYSCERAAPAHSDDHH